MFVTKISVLCAKSHTKCEENSCHPQLFQPLAHVKPYQLLLINKKQTININKGGEGWLGFSDLISG